MTKGKSSGEEVKSTDTSVDGEEHVLYQSYPIVTVNALSPSGTLSPSNNMLLAILDVKAAGDKDVTWDGNDEDDEFYFQVSSLDGASTTAALDIIIQDQYGNQLDNASTAAEVAQTNIKCDFSDKDFIVPAGETRQLKFFANTSGFITVGDGIQLWLDDGGTGLDWSIDKDAADYNEVAKIFRGDIYAGALSK